jgi:PAS domain S-box-containing protein
MARPDIPGGIGVPMAKSSRQQPIERRGVNRRLSDSAVVRERPSLMGRAASDFDAFLAFPNAAAIVEHAARAAIATDGDNLVLHWNSAATELLGYPAEDAVGRNLQLLINARDIHGNRLTDEHCAFHEMVRMGEAPRGFELDIVTAAGHVERVAVSIVVILGPRPAEYSLVYLMSPIRRRRRSDEAIDRLLADNGNRDPAAPTGAGRRGTVQQAKLTRRQLEVLRLIAEGHGAQEIAETLGISIHTVRTHTQSVLRALGAGSRLEAVSKALNQRII